MKLFLRIFLFAIIWGVVVFLLILMPGQEVADTEEIFLFDKMAHLSVFIALSFLLTISIAKYACIKQNFGLKPVYAILITGSYSIFLEVAQMVIPERTSSFYDLIFNLAGIIIGYFTYLIIYKFSFA